MLALQARPRGELGPPCSLGAAVLAEPAPCAFRTTRETPPRAAVERIRPTTPSSGIAHQLRRGPFEQLDGLLPRYRGVVVQKVVESVTRLEVLPGERGSRLLRVPVRCVPITHYCVVGN